MFKMMVIMFTDIDTTELVQGTFHCYSVIVYAIFRVNQTINPQYHSSNYDAIIKIDQHNHALTSMIPFLLE